MTLQERDAPARRPWSWWVVRVLPGVVALVVGARVLASRRSELSGAAAALGHLSPAWVAVATVAECGSLAAYVALQRRLLDASGVTVGLTPLTGITLAGYAIQNSLPAGPAWSAVFAFRQLRRQRADSIQAGWTLVVTALISDVSLAALGLVGVVLAHRQAATLDVVEVMVAAALLTVAAVAAARRGLVSERSLAAAAWFVALWRRVTRRPHTDSRAIVTAAVDRLRAVRPSGVTWGVAAGLGLANWVFDCSCLALAFAAVHAAVPWRGLLLAYGTGQMAANLPITPGGLGVVEGSLSIALVYYGGGQTSTVAAVLLYRLLSFWILLPLGWASWVALRWSGRRAARLLVQEPAR